MAYDPEHRLVLAVVPGARSLAAGPDGIVFVGTRGEGKVYAVVDKNGDGKADEVLTIAKGLNMQAGRARQSEIIEAADMQDRHVQVDPRIFIGSKEGPGFGRVSIFAEAHMQGFFYICYGGLDLQQHPVRMGGCDRETVAFEEFGNGLVLRALHGLVEVMIEFIASTESSHLLGLAHVHKSAENSPLNWMSAPILCGVQAKGAVVVARTDANDSLTLSFLENTAFRIGHLLEGSASNHPILPSLEKIPNK